MLTVCGYIAYPCDLPGHSRDGTSVYSRIHALSEGRLSWLGHSIQNAMIGISLFDFSNHDGGTLECLKAIVDFLSGLESEDIIYHISYVNEETEITQVFSSAEAGAAQASDSANP